MRHMTRIGRGALIFGAGFSAAAVAAVGQEPPRQPQPAGEDSIVRFNQGVLNYLRGGAETDLPQALADFERVLAEDPANTAALLFRALCHGRMALDAERKATDARSATRLQESRKRYRQESEFRQRIDEELRGVDERLRGGVDPQEQLLFERRKEVLEGFRAEAQPSESVASTLGHIKQWEQGAQQHYAAMSDDLGRLLAGGAPEDVIRLLDAVSLTKLAKLEEQQAVELAEQGKPGREALRERTAERLREAGDLLQVYADSAGINAEARIRARFFQAVVTYRRAVPKRAAGEGVPVSTELLEKARTGLSNLKADINAAFGAGAETSRWLSYTELYLGLVATELGKRAQDAAARGELLDSAARHLLEAVHRDAVVAPAEEGGVAGKPTSASGKLIPELVTEQLLQIEELRGAPQLQPIEDVQLSFALGPRYDTNVVLLGERTDLPHNIPHDNDFGVRAGSAITYTLSLDKYGPKSLHGWTLGAQARTGELWNREVEQFDEQDYGGSVVLQYELPRNASLLAARTDLSLEYDYDYFLLEREKFVDAHQLAANARFRDEKDRQETNLTYSHAFRDYNEPMRDRRLDRDGTYSRVGIGHSIKLADLNAYYDARNIPSWGHSHDDALKQEDPDYPNRYVKVVGSFQYGWDSTAGDEFDLKTYILSLGMDFPLPWGWVLKTDCGFEWQNYNHGSVIDYHRRYRDDFVQRYGLAVSRLYVLRGGSLENRYLPTIDRLVMAVEFGVSWTLDDSNVVNRLGEDVFEYDRAVVGATVRFTFN
jgi:hypothetical protein